jgi:hypothetical protein
MTLWGKNAIQIEVERQRMLAEREERLRCADFERTIRSALYGPRTPEELGAHYAAHLPPDAPLQLGEDLPGEWAPETGGEAREIPSPWVMAGRVAFAAALAILLIGAAYELAGLVIPALS